MLTTPPARGPLGRFLTAACRGVLRVLKAVLLLMLIVIPLPGAPMFARLLRLQRRRTEVTQTLQKK